MTRLEQLAAMMSDLVAEMVQAGSTKDHVLACAELAWWTGQPTTAGTEQTPTIISSLDAAIHRAMMDDPDVTLSAVVSMAQAADIREYLYSHLRFYGDQHTSVTTYRGTRLQPVHRAQCSVLIVSRRYAGESEPRVVMTVPLLPDPATQPTKET